ncbi:MULTISPECIES: hypothetical protein [Methylosinus]|uniref:hypothetical protein n=1 Tax=Methylosinus TaxID=425 RepID=UPI0012DC05AC|nr:MULTISPECIES: hypothetical protein [Methylosinus]
MEKSAGGILRAIIRIAEVIGIPVVVSAAVSTGMNSWFESRLENSKDHIAAIIKEKEGFDESQVNIFGQLGIYTNSILSNDAKQSKDELFSAIVAAQLHISRLRSEVSANNNSVFNLYAAELDTLRARLKDAKGVNDLKAIYMSAQRILELHDEVSSEVRAKMQVSIF